MAKVQLGKKAENYVTVNSQFGTKKAEKYETIFLYDFVFLIFFNFFFLPTPLTIVYCVICRHKINAE